MAGEQGFEPRLPDPESGVLPLDDSPLVRDAMRLYHCVGGMSSRPSGVKRAGAGWANEGMDVLLISRLMGHTDVKTTGLYLGQFGSADARKRVGSLVDGL